MAARAEPRLTAEELVREIASMPEKEPEIESFKVVADVS
jgi:hypothetical protein